MDTDSPQTPDVDLPGQPHDQADLDIVVEPEPEPEPGSDGAGADESDSTGASPDDPALGNTLIRPDNS
jgi:hypothetical protein